MALFGRDRSQFDVSDAVFQISALLEAEDDLDLFLYGPDGEELASSTNGGGPETVSARVNQPGTYRYRVSGWLAAATDYTLTSTLEVGGLPPQVNPLGGDYVNNQGQAIDFNGKGQLSWVANGGEHGFEVEHSSDGVDYSVVAELAANATSYNFNLPDGLHHFRVRALFPGKIGHFVSAASEPTSILIDHRSKKRITRDVSTAMSNVSLVDGVFQMDLRMTNNSAQDYLPLVNLQIVKIRSASGTVSVINADNGGSGLRRSSAALFDYSHQLGSDEVFSAGEASGTRTLRFSDMASEMFSFDIVVSGYQRNGAANSGGDGADSTPADGSETESDPLTDVDSLLRVTVNPLTGTVVTELVNELLGNG